MGLSENNATKAKTMFYWMWHGCWTRPDRIWSVTSKIYAEVQGKPKDVCGTYYGERQEMVGNAPILNMYFKSWWRWSLNESMWNFSTNLILFYPFFDNFLCFFSSKVPNLTTADFFEYILGAGGGSSDACVHLILLRI